MTMQQVSRDEAQARLQELLDAALRGEEIYITGEGVVRVPLVPVETPPKRRQFGSAKGMITMSDDFDAPLPEFEEYMR
jgi:antitoxin (DNA-binding transcriptional repressor) of toxin-antitoxin stability system